MQALKALVIVLGLLIFVAFGFLAYGVATKFDTGPGKVKVSGSFGESQVDMPAGASPGDQPGGRANRSAYSQAGRRTGVDPDRSGLRRARRDRALETSAGPMNFCSDNVAGASPEILERLVAANTGAAMPYGDDALTQEVVARLQALFETDAEILLMSTGSSANALALATMTPPYGAVYCHPDSHVNVDECGAPEFFTGGAKLVPVGGPQGKIAPDALAAAATGAGVVHHVQPAAVSITQVTEAGTIYSRDEIRALAAICREHGLKLHMDGARFANAVEALGCSPAEASHRLGVDALSFGATKNGALCAEAILFFDAALARDAGYRRKRAGHLFSKMRFLAAQWDAYLADDLWRRNARHANAMAARLAAGLAALPGVSFEHPVEANELFVRMPHAMIEGILAQGFMFYRWEPEGTLVRLVTAFDTDPGAVEAFLAAAARLAD